MKNYFIVIIALSSILSFSACSENESVADSNDNDSELTSSSDSDVDEDSSSSADKTGTDEDGKSSSSSVKVSVYSSSSRKAIAEEYLDSAVTGIKLRSDKGNITITKDEIQDSKSGEKYKTIHFGPYVLMAENAKDKHYGICYDRDSVNCEKYGRLYRIDEAPNVCPKNFYLPTADDYMMIASYMDNFGSEEFGFNLQMGGTCVEEGGEISCSGLGKNAGLLAREGAYVRVKDGNKIFVGKTDDKSYYSVRCIAYSFFVENEDLLPPCNSRLNRAKYYVANKHVNYYCDAEKWNITDDVQCPYSSKGTRFYYDDTLFVCNDKWKVATMDDLEIACVDSIAGQVQAMNGKRYLCEKGKWREATALESSIGFCSKKNLGSIDTLFNPNVSIDYFCDSTGWRRAVNVDYLGKCDSSAYYNEKSFKGVKYVCRVGGSWNTLTKLEDSLGVCSPKRTGTVDTITIEKDTTFYYCDSTSWRLAEVWEAFGKCNKDKLNKVVDYKKASYVCRESGAWDEVTSLEKNLGICTSQMIGKIKRSSNDVVYYCSSTGWRVATNEEILGPCDSTSLYTVKYGQGQFYGCEEIPNWTKLAYPESDLGYCTPAMKDSIRIDKKATDFICDSVWREATQEEVLGECTEAINDKVKWFGKKRFMCNLESWYTLTGVDEQLGTCTQANLKERGKYGMSNYVCTKMGWLIVYTPLDGDPCTDAREGEVIEHDGVDYVCRDGGWIEARNNTKVLFGKCTSKREGEMLKYGNFNYLCRNKEWVKVTGPATLYGECTEAREEEAVLYNNTNYMCHNKRWVDVKPLDAKFGFCNFERDGKLIKEDGKTYLCNDGYWEYVSGFLAEYGKCKEDREGFSVRYDGVLYKCQSSRWILPEA